MKFLLRGVKHAPNVCFNLIFVHMLDDCSYDNHFGSGKWKLNNGNLVVARGESFIIVLDKIFGCKGYCECYQHGSIFVESRT